MSPEHKDQVLLVLGVAIVITVVVTYVLLLTGRISG